MVRILKKPISVPIIVPKYKHSWIICQLAETDSHFLQELSEASHFSSAALRGRDIYSLQFHTSPTDRPR
uniref:Uncharacterized protein n=1 Tax=Anguilla anguilla TaxID=7936 RepID=A0A0E9R0B1_ANGAN